MITSVQQIITSKLPIKPGNNEVNFDYFKPLPALLQSEYMKKTD